MSKQNKITSYFNNSNSKINSAPKKEPRKRKYVHDDDCFIVEENVKTGLNIVKPSCIADVSGTDESIDRFTPILPAEKNKSFNENDTEEFEASELTDEILSQKLEEYESQNDSSATVDIDDHTVFFINMIDSFLEKDHLFYLFDASGIKFLQDFVNVLSIHSKKLFARLYWLQWKWYKVSDIVTKYLKTVYSECSYSQTAVKLLQKNQFLLNGTDEMNFDDFISVLLRPELIKICNHFNINVNKSDKSTMTTSLKKLCKTRSTILNHAIGGTKTMEKNILKIMSLHVGECVKISEPAKLLFDRLHLATYLGMNPAILREKKLNLLLINIKNRKQSFPAMNIECDSIACIFPTQKYFHEYFTSYVLYEDLLKLTMSPPLHHENIIKISRQCYQNYKKLNSNEELNSWDPPLWLHGFTPGYRYIKCLEMSIGSYKAMKSSEYISEILEILSLMLEQNKYRQHKRALWYNENALILQTRLQNHKQAADLLVHALQEPNITDNEKAPLTERAKRIACQKNISLPPDLKNKLLTLVKEPEFELPYIEIFAKTTDQSLPGKKAQYVFRDVITDERTYSSVEDYSLTHYMNNTPYIRGEHWEGRIIHSIFVLLFWDIIYSPIDGVKGIFISIYQDAPLDLYTDHFYKNRKDKIEARLNDIESGWSNMESIIEFMQDIFLTRKEGEFSLFHDGIEWQTIAEITHCLGRNGLLCICKRLSNMYHYAHSGFPDLTIWNPSTKQIKFVEVKGDGDKLSHKQIQWMTHMLKYNVETEVCYVHKGSNLKKSRTASKSSPKKSKKKPAPESSQIENDQTDFKKLSRKSNKSPRTRKKNVTANKIEPIISPSKSEDNTPKTPTKTKPISPVMTPPKSKTSPSSKNNSPNKSTKSSPQTGCYLKSPTKFSKGGVGYFSPKKEETSPKKRLSLSLTRRRIFEIDT